jgi:hypothetical protein
MIVSESYLHFEPRHLELPLREIGERTLPVVETAANEFFFAFRNERRVEVVLEEGSLRHKSLIVLAATVLVKYSELRTGIREVWHDGKAAAGWLTEHVQNALDIPSEDIIARRSRSPAPSQLLRLFENVRAGTMSPEEATERAERLFTGEGESDEAIRMLTGRVMKDFQSISGPPVLRRPRKRRAPRPFPEPDQERVATPTRRLRFFRDSAGKIRIVEEG